VSTNQQRREAAKRKLERQIEARAARAKRNRIIAAGAIGVAVIAVIALVLMFVNQARQEARAEAAREAKAAAERKAEEKKQLDEAKKISDKMVRELKIPSKRMKPVPQPKPFDDPTSCKYPKSGEEPAKDVDLPKDTKAPASGKVNVTFHTTAGEIGMEMDRALAPCTVNSMVSLIEQGYYDGSSCHRLGIQGLQMLQCGDPTGTGQGGPGYTVPDEFHKKSKYGRGLVAMANTGAPNSGGGQFFLIYGTANMTNGQMLPPQYTVFGTISDEGLKTLEKVARKGIEPKSLIENGDGTGKPNLEVKFTEVSVKS
jgi:peptidyl-prolyl cis-trans isomerase B (cyclophilin B)